MEKTPINHNADSIVEACGIDVERISSGYTKVINKLNESLVKQDGKISEFVEDLENNFSHRELAFMYGQKILEELVQPKNPLQDLLESLKN